MSLIRKFASVGGATMASRVLGFVREAMIAGFLGAGPVADAFYAAFRFPNLFRRLFAEGAFNAAFVPLFAKEIEGGGPAAAKKFAEQVLSVLLLSLFAISALAMIFMPFLVGTVIAPKFADDPEKFELTVLLARIMFPYLAAMSLVAMLAGILNSLRRYFLAALAPVLLNVVLVASLVAAGYLDLSAPIIGEVLGWSVTVSGLLQLGLLVWALKREGFGLGFVRPRLTPAVKRLLWLALPAAVTGGITQINLLIGQIIASAQDGAIAIINYADRLNQLPLGVIGIAIGVVLLPELSRALQAGDMKEAKYLQNRSLEFGLAITVPAAVGLALLPEPIIALVFERGAFTRETTLVTASVLAAFSIGLPAFVLSKIFTPVFYAREDMRTPLKASVVSVVINIVGSLVLFPRLGVMGLAIATSLAGWISVFYLGQQLFSRDLFRPAAVTIRRIGLIVIGAALMGGLLWWTKATFPHWLLDASLLVRLATVLMTIAAACVVYFGFAFATGALNRAEFARLLKRSKKS
ncbi:murein biosynthesis integral membrane protein MurJ [Hoeflea sp. IMCC20628]|uniref:murein biosynthesis integral membrane protein MurJ n=1 Tax=Hoeflea sp. IMCC20628 TaxID=1620421 RepID=UPI00063A9548|nr:murein biosynthesis integral membrane protein MurJ [Hoeflea sp. IMCC20628]AKI02607.1 murein biosynthesis integral membrane protein MurJ [Hoeflea sp. IMCC20628]